MGNGFRIQMRARASKTLTADKTRCWWFQRSQLINPGGYGPSAPKHHGGNSIESGRGQPHSKTSRTFVLAGCSLFIFLTLTLGHSPDPDDAFMFYALAKELIPTDGLRFEHVLQDIQTLNERATRGELDISAISIHAYAYVSDKYALLPSGASMGDGYGPMLVARQKLSRDEILKSTIAVPGTMTSAFLALQLWLGKPASQLNYIVVPFDQIFAAIKSGKADVGLIIHEGQLTYQNEGLQVCEDLGVWWGRENDGLPLPLGGNVIHKRFEPSLRKKSRRSFPPASNTASIIGRKPFSTLSNTPAIWAASWPTSSSACT
jgi:predicted solute-binding protein